jgi:hypothetical protein
MNIKQRMNVLALAVMAVMFLSPVLVSAALDLNQQPNAQDQATFDQILTPVMKIYNLIKYVASALAGIALLGSGITYMTAGSDPKKRDNAKAMTMYVLIGLAVIWAAPFVVSLIVG